MIKKTYKIEGMQCSSCAKSIELELEDKVKKISVDFNKGKTEIEFDENKISEKDIKNLIIKMGYKVTK